MRVYADSVLCVGQMKDSPREIERWKGQVEGLRLYSSFTKKQWESMEKRLNSSEQVPRIFVIVCSSRETTRVGDKEHPARRLQGPDHLNVNVQ